MRFSNALLSVSGSQLSDTSCQEIAKSLQACNIPCKIINTHSVVPSRGLDSYEYEHGCDIWLTNVSPTKIIPDIWKPIQKQYQLGCAYLEIIGGFSGCIYNYMRPTNCPGHCSSKSNNYSPPETS